LSVEAATDFGWSTYSHASVGMKTFGMSGPGPAVFKEFGFTPDNVAEKAQTLINFYKNTGAPVPNLTQKAW